MTTAIERVWELYTLKQTLEDQLQDVKAMLEEAKREAYEDEGQRNLPEGYTIRRSETRDISIKAFREKYPEIYESAMAAKVRNYNPELTKTDVRKAIGEECEGLIRTKEEQERILADIEDGSVSVRYTIYRPADPNPGRVVE